MLRVLITRPIDAALPLKAALEALGHESRIESLLTIEQTARPESLPENTQAIALTSANAVPALGEAAKRFPVYAVGPATADAARAAGCERLVQADGDAIALAAAIAAGCRPEDGKILHLSGEVVREDLERILVGRGFAFERRITYRALAVARLSDDLQAAFCRREVDAVLLFSPRTSAILARLLIDHGLARHVDSTAAICLSEPTATPCRALAWRTICVAARPNQRALIQALEGSIGIC